ncbi:hypothetical protein B0D71_00475 [Pseudomonas laurylsulfativorans]|uniref:Copper resistance protein CopC n=1 Tax=Pseudomonas laurylsulfativorans TaxID=1943631 RepID=A0A2S3VWR9_9PSED|nr:DUF6130 family protein [Pseudomonas laurylsulfativorans]POF44377.1 hypothetical protein B0D71_00475 [Pseudomonas laurylsulfativorans]
MSLASGNLLALALGAFFCTAVCAQGGADTDSPPAILPLESEAAPTLIAYPPLAEPLARGVVIIQYRAEHARIMPVFGKVAADVSPHLAHLHVTVDDWKGTWAHTSEDPIILVGLTPGTHKVLLEVADPTHKILTRTTVSFVVPQKKPTDAPHVDDDHAEKP